MKPIIVDMKEMSDSTEVYESRPNPCLIYFIYILAAMFMIALLWMAFSKIDIVVKSDGMLKSNESVYEISSGATGRVSQCNVKDGQYVNEGEVLYTLEDISHGDAMQYYQDELDNVNARIAILQAYDKYLNGDCKALDSLGANIYYQEIINRKELLNTNIAANTGSVQEADIYKDNIAALNASILQYETKIKKLQQVKTCITSRTNTFKDGEDYYKSLVDSYISNYNLTASQYNAGIAEYQTILDEYNEQSDLNSNAKEARDIVKKIETLKLEKEWALSNLELQQIASVEQQIESINDTIISLEANISTAKNQLAAINSSDKSYIEEVYMLTERSNLASEILTYQSKKDEYENYLRNYDTQNNNCSIKATASGYFYLQQDIKTGTYVQEGASIGKIYQETETEFYAQIYVENADIAKLKEGQEVKFEISAYPSSEYGYFTGKITNIPKDISIDQSTGRAYYLVVVSCENTTIKNKDGESVSLMNGMACQAKIVVDEENVLTYLLRKIDLLD